MKPPFSPVLRSRPVGRYAPSPTGELHIGNLRTALEAWRDCRARDGIFILRVEDIDLPRTVPGAERRMIEDLRWLGLDWDEGPDFSVAGNANGDGPAAPYRQSVRSDIYEWALGELERRGLTYLCTCSRKELRMAEAAGSAGAEASEASAPHDLPDQTEGPVYPGTCRERDPASQRLHPAGAAVRIRVDLDPIIEFTDLRLGQQRFDLRELCGDFVIKRRDGLWAYQLACAVDDALMGVTHVWRGEDLLSSTPRQIAIIRALGLPVPQYGHLPLVVDERGERMCKRDGSCSVRSWREAGISPEEARERIMAAPTKR